VDVDSDDTDHEGETHVSRVMKQYYRQKYGELPAWLDVQETYAEDARSNQPQREKRQVGGGMDAFKKKGGQEEKNYDFYESAPVGNAFHMEEAPAPKVRAAPKFKGLGAQVKRAPPPKREEGAASGGGRFAR
jgi:hypothetical protein